jgi:hypothetical protein
MESNENLTITGMIYNCYVKTYDGDITFDIKTLLEDPCPQVSQPNTHYDFLKDVVIRRRLNGLFLITRCLHDYIIFSESGKPLN